MEKDASEFRKEKIKEFPLGDDYREKLIERLCKVSLHELGHNLGLNHCDNNQHCLMNDARGTIKTVDNEKMWLCDGCQEQIQNKK